MKLAIFAAVAFLLAVPFSVYAQTGTEGCSLRTVADVTGAVVPGAAVTDASLMGLITGAAAGARRMQVALEVF